MRRLLFSFLTLAGFSLLTLPAAADGAFVVASYHGGVSCVLNYNLPDTASATAAALAYCRNTPGSTNCRVMATFRDSCYAYAFAPGGGYGAAGGGDLNAAQQNALAACQRANPGTYCYVRDSGCDTIAANQEAWRIQQEQARRAEDEREDAEDARRAEEEEREAQHAQKLAELESERAELDRQRQRLARQQQERERIRLEREQQERQLAELRAFAAERNACRTYDSNACDTALRSPHASPLDLVDLRGWRGLAEKLRADLDGCKTGSRAACDAALASPALTDEQRPLLNEWRSAASPVGRAMASFSVYAGMAVATSVEALATIRGLPTSTHVTGGIAALLALTLAAMALRIRRLPTTEQPEPKSSPVAGPDPVQAQGGGDKPTEQPQEQPGWRQRFSARLGRFYYGVVQSAKAPTVAHPHPRAAPPAVRDTPAAIAALELAHAYIEEVRQADTPEHDDRALRKHQLNNLSLAAKQLDAAQKFDPDAMLEGHDEKENPYRYSINELKSEALLLEGVTHQTYDLKRAIPALRRATALNPNNARAFHVLGLTHAANMQKRHAVVAFERAVALDPKNLTYRKELNRAQSLSAAEIATYKATRAGERVFDASIKTANTGIFILNVGIYIWNAFVYAWIIVTFPLRIIFAIGRALRILP